MTPKVPMTLAQLIMMFGHWSVSVRCAQDPTDYSMEFWKDHVYNLPDEVKQLEFIHCSEEPDKKDFNYWIDFYTTDSEGTDLHEYYVLKDSNLNESCEAFCKITTAIALLLRETYEGDDEDELNLRRSSDTFFGLNFMQADWARTEIFTDDDPQNPIASFDTALDIPFFLYEQRKYDSNGKEQTWGHEQNGNRSYADGAVSKIYARFVSRENQYVDAIVVPLRIDGTGLPMFLFDATLVYGFFDPSPAESEESEDNK